MSAPHTPLEFRLLNDYQRGFPLVPRPFAALARELGSSEETVLAALVNLSQQGVVSRVGAVLAPRRVGASTLAALRAPRERLDDIAAMVNVRPEVNHNYEREHAYNLWFVATAADEEKLATVLADIADDTGCPVIPLPMLEEFHIDLGFDLAGGRKVRVASVAHHEGALRPLPSPVERRLLAVLQPGLELVPRPFERLAERAEMNEVEVLAHLATWLDEGVIKRLGVVVRHHELGYTTNAMVVFDVPDIEVNAIGTRLAAEDGVTLCYRRRRHLPEWPYNLFCMVHGRGRDQVAPVIERLRGVAAQPCEILYSTRRFKQCGARYFDVATTV